MAKKKLTEEEKLEKIKQYRKNYYQKNKKRIAEYQKEYYLKKKGYAPNTNLNWKGEKPKGLIIKRGTFIVHFD